MPLKFRGQPYPDTIASRYFHQIAVENPRQNSILSLVLLVMGTFIKELIIGNNLELNDLKLMPFKLNGRANKKHRL